MGTPRPGYSPRALPGQPLTARECEVLELIALGIPSKWIGAQLGIALQTVKNHLRHIYAKTGATNRVEAANWLRAHTLLGAPIIIAWAR